MMAVSKFLSSVNPHFDDFYFALSFNVFPLLLCGYICSLIEKFPIHSLTVILTGTINHRH